MISGYATTGYDLNGNLCPPMETSSMQNGGFEDYSGMGPTRLEDTDLYNRSINVSDAHPAEADPERPASFRRKVTRRVEVPFTRKVKVPTRTTKIVPTTVQVKVPVKKIIQVPSYKIVDEEYTVFEEREAVREKEIWVKQVVPEKYMQKVPVRMTRQVKKASHEIREVEELVSVDVPSSQAIEVDGFRIDDVEDTKVVEVEEFHEFEYRAHATGTTELSRTRELGRLPNSRIGRVQGTDTFHPEHPDLSQLDLDSNPGRDTERPFSASHENHMHSGRPASRGRPDATRANYSNDNFTRSDQIRAAGQNLGIIATNSEAVREASGGLGLKVRNTHTRHSDGTGVLVTMVEHGGRAALAGLKEMDIITSVNDIPTMSVEEFAEVLQRTEGELKIYFNRDGRRNVFCHLQR